MTRDVGRSWKDDPDLRKGLHDVLRQHGLKPKKLHGRRGAWLLHFGKDVLEAIGRSGYMENMIGVPMLPPDQE